MTYPSTYSEWVNLLDKFGNGDDTSLIELYNGNFTVDAGTANRFYVKVEEVYKKRKQSWLENFQKSFQLQKIKSEDELEIILRNGKQNLLPLSRYVSLKGLPEDLRKTLKNDLDDFVSEIQNSLKDNVPKNSNGREKILLLLNTFSKINTNEEIITKADSKNQKTIDNSPQTGRKIIF